MNDLENKSNNNEGFNEWAIASAASGVGHSGNVLNNYAEASITKENFPTKYISWPTARDIRLS